MSSRSMDYEIAYYLMLEHEYNVIRPYDQFLKYMEVFGVAL